MDKGTEVSGEAGEGPKGKGYLKETVHGMLRRCEGWDYSLPCIYMITLVLANRRSKVLGEVVGSSVIGDNIADHRTPGFQALSRQAAPHPPLFRHRQQGVAGAADGASAMLAALLRIQADSKAGRRNEDRTRFGLESNCRFRLA